MRYVVTSLILGAVSLLALPVLAEPPVAGGDKGDRPARGEMRARMLKEHDKDGDGKLSDEERQKARESMRDRFGGRKKEGRPGAGKKPGDKKQGEKGPHGPGGPPLPPPEELFAKFDADGNDSLSREEFGKLAEFVKRHHPLGPPQGGPPGRSGFRSRGPDGPPPRDGERWREWRREGPPRDSRPGPRDGDRRRGDRVRRPDGSPEGPPPNEDGAGGDVEESI